MQTCTSINTRKNQQPFPGSPEFTYNDIRGKDKAYK